jgi:hypothetical protein
MQASCRGAQVALPRGIERRDASARIAAFTLFSMMLLFAMITLFAAAIFRHADAADAAATRCFAAYFCQLRFCCADASATFFFSPFSRRRLPFRCLLLPPPFISFHFAIADAAADIASRFTLHYVFAIF